MHESIKIQQVQLDTFLSQLCALIKTDFSARGVHVRNACDDGVGFCMADPRALHQVMLNLFSNAADALEQRDNPTIFVTAARSRGRITIQVIDNGRGMSEQQQAEIFKPFYTSKHQGTGLGLVIVKNMMLKMNGTISISSQPDVGTRVTLTLEAVPLD